MEQAFKKQAYLILRLGPRQSFQWEAEMFANLVDRPNQDMINVSLGNVGTMTFMYTDRELGLIHANLRREYAERNLPLAVMLFKLEDGAAYLDLDGNPSFKKIIQDFRDESGITERDKQERESAINVAEDMTADDIFDLALDQYGGVKNLPQVYKDRLKKLSE